MNKPDILIVTSKWRVEDSDGGLSTVVELCDTLSKHCNLDILTECSSMNHKRDGIRRVYGFNIPDDLKETSNGENKFQARISIAKFIGPILDSMINNYDKIIVLHGFHLFDICRNIDSNKALKIILFPMMLTPSYVASNEAVPEAYTLLEKKVLKAVGKIITPSIYEKRQITDLFNILETKIALVPRYVPDTFTSHTHTIITSNRCEICYIASIKKQKHNILSLDLLYTLLHNGINARLHIVGAIHDKEIYNEMLEYINVKALKKHIMYHGVMSQSSISSLYRDATFAISTSLCETFGRSVMEGLTSGVPTIIMKDIACLETFCDETNGVIRVASIKEMADAIMYYLQNPKLYSKLSSAAIRFGYRYRRRMIQPILENELMK